MKISICYYYQRGNKSGDGLTENICRHHVISYPRMFYLGVLALCYLKKCQRTNEGAVYRLGELLKTATGNHSINVNKALGEIIYDDRGNFHLGPRVTSRSGENFVREQNEELYKTIGEIAWLPMNTFSGPVESLRGDDPSQRNEIFPYGMPEAQKQALRNIMNQLDCDSHSFIPHEEGQGGITQCVRFENEAQFDRLATVFFNEISRSWRRYESKISDWLVASTFYRVDNRSYFNTSNEYYHFFFNKSRRGEECLTKKSRVVFGDFVLKGESLRRCHDDKALKILSIKEKKEAKGNGNIKAVMVNSDAAQSCVQDRQIKDFF